MRRCLFILLLLCVAGLLRAEVRELSGGDFATKVVASKRPVVIDFYTTWCGPCKMMAPVMESLSGSYKGKVDFYKVDIEKERELADLFGITSIPTFVFWPVGGLPKKRMGAVDRVKMEGYVKDFLLKK